jgi:hypothetical protein
MMHKNGDLDGEREGQTGVVSRKLLEYLFGGCGFVTGLQSIEPLVFSSFWAFAVSPARR